VTANLILASSSPFRKELLNRLNVAFECHSPEVDESLLSEESADSYVRRLAVAKAQKLAMDFPGAIIIGSDQCAVLGDEILGKPGNHLKALEQLKKAQGKTVVFHTGLCVLQPSSSFQQVDNILFRVNFRNLSDRQLEHYLRTEEPYQCAGSFKSEGYGVALFSKMTGDDPTALIGLPLIRLTHMLEQAGISVV